MNDTTDKFGDLLGGDEIIDEVGGAPAELMFGVSDFVAAVNQVVEYALQSVVITGELANFRVSKGKWLYFDLKDEAASVRFFGTVYMLPGPLDDGMMLEVRGQPRLHPQFGFSVNVQSIRLVGEGAIRKAAQLLQAKLAAEGLFDASRKRPLPYPPAHIGLITSGESAAYADFIKILAARWGGVHIALADVQVQGEPAPGQIVAALQWFNGQSSSTLGGPVEALVLIRGGGSADDLQAFNHEAVVRAVAASRLPTLVAIGHENDVSLAELAADQRASTPSNAAELLVPDKQSVLNQIRVTEQAMADTVYEKIDVARQLLADAADDSLDRLGDLLERERLRLAGQRQLAQALDPAAPLRRGYALVRDSRGAILRQAGQLKPDDIVHISMSDAEVTATVRTVDKTKEGKPHA